MHPMEDDFVNDDPLAAAEKNGPPRRRRRPAPSVLEPRPRRREQIRSRSTSARERTELFLRENPVPMIIGALAAGLAIGLAIRYASRSDEENSKVPLDRINWSVLSLPFLWPLFRSMKEKVEESADAVSEGVKSIDLDRYTKPIRKRWKSWTN
jgi:DNA-binding transcriptional LysR family regulator